LSGARVIIEFLRQDNETYVSTIEPQKEEQARFPGTDGNSGRAQGIGFTSQKGTLEAICIRRKTS